MSKAILIIDMPKKCGECIFKKLHTDADKTWCCGLITTLKSEMICVDKYDFPDSNRPEECPLKLIPEKKDTNQFLSSRIFEAAGYNECIDDILSQ